MLDLPALRCREDPLLSRSHRPSALALWAWFLAWSLLVPFAAAQPEPPAPPSAEQVWAKVEQELLPAWSARTEAATRQLQARRAWLAGEGAFEAAWPDLADDPLNQREVLQGRLVLLDQRGVARARERVAPVPSGADPARQQAYRQRRQAMHEVEEAADALERKLLQDLLASLELHPELTHARLAARMLPWTERVRVARDLPGDAAPERVRDLTADAARAATEVRRFERMIRGIQRSAVGPEPPPSPEADLARIEQALNGDEVDGAAAATRLELLDPFLPAELQATVEPVLDRWFGDIRLEGARRALELAQQEAASPPPADSTPASLQRELEVTQAELLAAEAELQELGDAIPAGSPRREALETVLEAHRLKVQAAERRVAAVRAAGGAGASGEAVRLAHEDALRAAEEAEAARASASGARERRRAEVLAAVARATDRAAKLREQVAQQEEEAKQSRDELAERIDSFEGRIKAIRTKSTFAEDRPDPDAVYRELRQLTMSLRSSPLARGATLFETQQADQLVRQRVAADRIAIGEAQELLHEEEPGPARDRLARAIQDWETMLTQEQELSATRIQTATTERDAALRVLQQAREMRRTLAPYISRQEAVRDRSHLLEDVGQELALLGPSIATMVRGRLQLLLSAPFLLLDFNVIRGLIVGSFWTFVMVGAWFWARGQVSEAARRLTDRIQRLRPEMRSADLLALRDPIARSLHAFVDLLLGWLLVGRLGALLPELGFILLVYLQVALYRALLAFFDLVVVRQREVRPALVALRDAEYELARTTVRVALSFLIARRFVLYVLWEVLGLDVITRGVHSLISLAALVLLGVALHAWEPSLRRRIARRDKGNRVVAWLARDEGTVVLRVVRSIGIVGFFAVALLVDLSYMFARERSSIGRLFNAVSRYRLSTSEEARRERLPDALVERLAETRSSPEERIPREEVEEVVRGALAYWQANHRQGMVAIVGDRGAGKRTACDEVEGLLTEAGLPVTRAWLDARLVTEQDMLHWLADLAGVPRFDEPDALVEALEALPPRAFLLEDMHRAYTRRVEGFAAMTTLLLVLNATSEEHFWVVSVHRLTWAFFNSIGSFVDMGVFRKVAHLEPLTSVQLRQLTCTRSERLGLEVDFGGLAQPSPLGGDPSVDLERAVQLFYRLLGEASEGNPKVAMHLWARSLEPDPERPERVRVYLSSALSTEVIGNLSDGALFALAALRIQDELDEAELVEATNIPRGVIRATVRDLIARGLLARRSGRLRIPDRKLPAVTRTLRRRHFLHLGA